MIVQLLNEYYNFHQFYKNTEYLTKVEKNKQFRFRFEIRIFYLFETHS